MLSPVLFCVYLDELLHALSAAKVGCYVGDIFVGALAYVDDVVLTAPSATALRKVLAICDAYASEYTMKFNATKSKCLVALPSCMRSLAPLLSKCAFNISGTSMEIVSSYCHLGRIISSSLSDEQDIMSRHNAFIGHFNSVLCHFGKLPSAVKARLFNSYCTSYYGCVLWDLSCSAVDDFCIAWRKSIRRIFNLPYQTHGYLLPLLCNCLPVYDDLCLRFINFVRSCMAHQSRLVSFIARYSTMHGRFSSPVGCNIRRCAQRYSCTVVRGGLAASWSSA